jgi:hypothetical protein
LTRQRRAGRHIPAEKDIKMKSCNKNEEKQFSFTVPQSRNYCAADLMYEYASVFPGVYFAHDHFFNAFLIIQSKKYIFDHWNIEKHNNSTETVTVYLKEENKIY